MKVYVLLQIDSEEPEFVDVIKVFYNKEDAEVYKLQLKDKKIGWYNFSIVECDIL